MNGFIVRLRDDPGHEGQRLRLSGYTPHSERGSLTAVHSYRNTFLLQQLL